MVGLKSCFFGVCSLRTGSLIFLWLTAVVNALISCLAPIIGSGIENLSGGESLVSFRLASAVFALYGISERKPPYLLPFIGVSVFQVLTEVVRFCFFLLLALLKADNLRRYGNINFYILVLLVVPAVVSYFTMVVYSYYRQMVNEITGINDAVADVVAPSAPVSHGTMTRDGGYPTQPQPVQYQPYYGGQQFDIVPL